MHGVGMERQIVFLREMEDADEIDGVALEHVLVDDVDAVVVDDEILGLAQRVAGARKGLGPHPAARRAGPGLAGLSVGGEGGGGMFAPRWDRKVVVYEGYDLS